MIENTWFPVPQYLPTHIYPVVLHVIEGRLHLGEDYIDVGMYNPDVGKWFAHDEVNGEDEEVKVSHWMQVSAPKKGLVSK